MSGSDFEDHLRRSVLSNFVFNLIINGGLAWWLLGKASLLTPWQDPAYGPDLVITGFLLCAIVAAIVMEINRRGALRGEAAPVPARWASRATASDTNRWGICLAAGLLGAAVSAIAVIACGAWVGALTVPAYAIFKGVWAGLLAAVVVVPATVLGCERGRADHARS